jgi:hypothetical protein
VEYGKYSKLEENIDMFDAGNGTIVTAILSGFVLGFAFWVIHKITNL